MRNSKWIRRIAAYGLIAVCIAAFYFFYIRGGTSGLKDTTPAADMKAAFPDKPAAQNLSSAYRTIAENDKLLLKVKESTLGIQVVEKQSGYVWSSEITNTDSSDNEAWTHFMKSGLSIDYFEKEKSNSTRTDLLTETNKSIQVKQIDQGFQATIRFNDLKIGLDLIVKLDGGQLSVEIPQKSILEGDQFKLASVFAYPFLGATKAGEIGGYMFIPDGSGALIKLADNKGKFNTPYEAKIYGADQGIDSAVSNNGAGGTDTGSGISDRFTNPPYSAQFPIFGIVHGEKQHALFGIIEKGQYNAEILSYPNGVNTPYNWTTAQFIVRQSYLQPTSRTMGGIVVFQKTRNPEDMRIRYSFLEGQDASYIGMANTYRSYLIAQGALPAAPKSDSGANIPIHLDVLGAETENGMFSKRLIPMTTVKQLESMLGELRAGGVSRTSVVYQGWNEGGLSGTNPAPVSFESSLGSAADFAGLNKQLKDQGGKLYYYSDFTTAYQHSKRFNARSDAAERFDKTALSLPTYQEVYDTKYYLTAQATKNIVDSNLKQYSKHDIASLAVDVTPSELFSEWLGSSASSRKQTADIYRESMYSLGKQIPQIAMYRPNDYMLPYAEELLDLRMDTSQYIFISETVPFEQILLKGYKDYFAEPANFDSKPQQSLLKMIETGSYPSYYLTYESSFLLKHTNSSDIYASTFADWKINIIQTYKTMNEALGPVQNATITDRTSLTNGVFQVTYSNGKAIVVNYNDRSYDGNGISVPPLGFRVIEVNS